MPSEVDEKEHERLKDQLAELREDVKRLLASAYYEIGSDDVETCVVGVVDIQALQETYDQQMRDSAQKESAYITSKLAPSIEMREALEWFLKPDEPIGSGPELIYKMEKRVKKALGTK